MVVFYSMICFSSEGDTCTQGIKNIIDNSNYSQIFELNRIELIEKINDLIIQFNNLKTKVENSGINDIKKSLSFDCIHAIIITSVEGPLCLR